MKRFIHVRTFFFLAVLGILMVAYNNFAPYAQGQDPWESKVDFDIIIVGGGASGVAAAIQAGRMGSSVLIIEETNWLGGQMTAAGVSTMDGGTINRGGLYKEIASKTKAANYSNWTNGIGTCYGGGDANCFEPSKLQAKLRDIAFNMSNGNVRGLFNTKVLSLTKSYPSAGVTQVVGVTTNNSAKQTLTAKYVIDATEYGDLLPMTGFNYRYANGTQQSPPAANACIQDITNTTVMKRYTTVPSNLVVTQAMWNSANNWAVTNDRNYGGYLSGVLKNDNHASVADVKKYYGELPAGVTGRTCYTQPTTYPMAIPFERCHVFYRGLPDTTPITPLGFNLAPMPYETYLDNTSLITKTGVNWFNDYPHMNLGEPYNLSNNTLNVSFLQIPSARFDAICRAKLRTFLNIAYIQRTLDSRWSISNVDDLELAKDSAKWGECGAAGYPIPAAFEKYMSAIPYVRESRRLIGSQTLTAKDLLTTGLNRWDAIAVGDANTDLHNCDLNSSLEVLLAETRADMHPGGLFQIPQWTLYHPNLKGFLVAEKNLSMSRLANGSIRMQPTMLNVGQAVGIIAHLSKLSATPAGLNFDTVQKTIALWGGLISRKYFADVPDTDPYRAQIQYIGSKGGLDPIAGFSPPFNQTLSYSSTMTRAEAARIVAEMFYTKYGDRMQHGVDAPYSLFADVPCCTQEWAAINYIAAKYGYSKIGSYGVDPNGNKLFYPNSPITRADLAFLLMADTTPPVRGVNDPLVFTDVGANGTPLNNLAHYMYSLGITTGCSAGLFCSSSNAARIHAILFSARKYGGPDWTPPPSY